MKLMGWKKMIEFKTNLKVTISAEYTISIKEKNQYSQQRIPLQLNKMLLIEG